MIRYIYAIAAMFLIPSVCFGQESLVGTYRLLDVVIELDGKPGPHPTLGLNPPGYLFITPKHFMATYAATNRKGGTSVPEKAALWDTLGMWGGPYQVQGDKLTVSVDLSWNESWTGKPQVRTYKLDGKRLLLIAPPQPFPRDPSKTAVAKFTWERMD